MPSIAIFCCQNVLASSSGHKQGAQSTSVPLLFYEAGQLVHPSKPTFAPPPPSTLMHEG